MESSVMLDMGTRNKGVAWLIEKQLVGFRQIDRLRKGHRAWIRREQLTLDEAIGKYREEMRRDGY